MLSDRPTKLVPPVLARMAAWSLCLVLTGVVVFYLSQIIARLSFVVLPVAIALLLTALLFPITRRLRQMGMRPIYATWLTMIAALAVLAGTGWLVGARATEEFPNLVRQVETTVGEVQQWLVTGPLHLQQAQINQYFQELLELIQAQRTAITGTVLSAGAVAVEVLASIVLLLFVTFFLLKDGERIWSWFLKGFGRMSPRVDRAGRAAWTTLSHYVQGSVLVAAVHGVVMGMVLAGMKVPLWAPLAVLIFLASFIPIVGIFFAGTVATLVTLGARGIVFALIFVGILVIEQQLENHVLQPLIVGRALRFHPLAIILVLSVGGILAGIAGAVVAVPVAAVIYRALPELMSDQPALPPPPAVAAATAAGGGELSRGSGSAAARMGDPGGEGPGVVADSPEPGGEGAPGVAADSPELGGEGAPGVAADSPEPGGGPVSAASPEAGKSGAVGRAAADSE